MLLSAQKCPIVYIKKSILKLKTILQPTVNYEEVKRREIYNKKVMQFILCRQ